MQMQMILITSAKQYVINPRVVEYFCGDTNARTSELVDYVTHGGFRSLSRYLQVQAEESPHSNIDETVNGYGKKIIDLCNYTGLQICNGRLCESAYTCLRYNGGSVVDYLLVPPNAVTAIGKLEVCDKSVYSDHCALSFALMGKLHGINPVKTSSAAKVKPGSIPVESNLTINIL